MTVLTKASPGRPDVRLMTWFFPIWYGAFGVIICILTRVTPPPRPDVTAATRSRSSPSTD
ncbi:hypothetical protein BN970_04072 [Mycolicibacterium conceptionense]|uniref:Uncharacterized protein n=1 Tax=Mycolicibacterium conceptionense TaxID=451644 RepID=A0A0U1DKR8_9MYCO|nr:hypothetical protein BN970_04072 [Mycolicibacterium conceptionense]